MTTKVPAELSSTPSIVDNGDATAITITSDEKVGIGTTSPSYMLTVKSSSNNHFRMENGSELGVLFLDSDGDMSVWAHGDENIKFLNGTGSGTERMRILSSGGITFNGDTAAANALDDYEEGTFTPTITSGITSVGYSAQTGYYTKIGNLVMFNLRIATSSGNAQSSTFAVGNLPFNSAATQQPGGAAIRAYASSFSSSGSQAFIGPASNSISFYTLAGTAFAGTSIVNHDDFDLRITGIYRA
jgi:hypothetical protein